MPFVDGSHAKLARAREHLEALHRELLSFMRTEPFSVRYEVDAENGDDVWRLKVREAAPLRLSVMAGDVAHNLRSSLDHLVWHLALTKTPTPYERAEFPIYEIKSDKGRECFDKRGRRKIQDLPPEAQDIIESVQPYHRRSAIGRELALLQEISNTDKHRIPLRAVARQTGLNIPLWCVDYLDAITGMRNDGDEVLRIRREAGRADLDEHDKKRVRVLFDVGIDTPKARGQRGSIIATFNQIHQAISEKLLPKLKRFL